MVNEKTVLFDFNSLVQITVIVATSYIVIVYGGMKKKKNDDIH